MTVIQKAYVGGISTRSVDDLVKAMGTGGMSKCQISRLCGEIDDRVNIFLNHSLEGRMAQPLARCHLSEGARRGRINSRAVIVAVAFNEDASAKFWAWPPDPRRPRFWTEFPRSLADRGLRGVKLVIADGHKPLRTAACIGCETRWPMSPPSSTARWREC